MFSCLLFNVLFTIISIISSTILKLHMGLVLFLDKICSRAFIRGYLFFYFYCAGMLKQNYWKQRPKENYNMMTVNVMTEDIENDDAG